MKIFYHGTTPTIAKTLFNKKVCISYGGGEFGKGFYVGSSRRLARRRAFHKTTGTYGNARDAMRYRDNILAIEFDIKLMSHHYKPQQLTKDKAIALFKSLTKKPKTTSSYVVSPQFDYIVGPVVGGKKRYLNIEQYKFDSKETENFLNGHSSYVPLKSSVI